MARNYIVLIISIVAFCNAAASQTRNSTVINFGDNNRLTVNKSTGLYTIKYGARNIIENAEAVFAVNLIRYSSADYAKRIIKIERVKDKIGVGRMLTLTSIKQGIPTMVQRFYCYDNQNYIVTQLEIQGRQLRSNYMAPLIASKANVGISNKLQTLFVPFDNDTFIRYKSDGLTLQPNISAEVGAIYDRTSHNGFIMGSLDHDAWKTGILSAGEGRLIKKLEVWGGLNDVNISRDSMPHGSLKGDTIKSPRIFIGYFKNWHNGLENYAKACRTLNPPYIKSWTKGTPLGWNSWGVIGTRLNYEKATGVADFFDKEIPSFRNEDGAAYIDLDSFWDNLIKGGLKGDFSKLKDFIHYCKVRNLQPGVYWAPFTDWGYKSTNRDRTAEGGNYKYIDMWTKTDKGYHDIDGARALDPTHPGTKARITFVLRKLKDCGFTMIKIDFLGHAAAESSKFYDPSISTGMQAFKIGMQTVSDALNNSMLVYAAISPSLATAPYTHMRRIACDAFKSIKDTEYTLNSLTYGWWQSYLYDYIDADHLVFENESIGANRARLISGLISGPVILGDDYSKDAEWQNHIKRWLQNPLIKQLVKTGKSFTPIDEGKENNGASTTFLRKDIYGTYLAVFNYKKAPANVTVSTSQLGLSKRKTYRLTELLDGQVIKGRSKITFYFSGEGAYIYKINNQ